LLRQFGIDERRLRLEWISASEGEKFARVANEFTEQVRALGPLQLEEAPAAVAEPQLEEVRA